MRLKALIFDVDGTLADTEEAHRCAFNQAFRAHGLDWHWNKRLYANLLSVGGGKQRLQAYVDSLPLPAPERAVFQRSIPALHATKTESYRVAVLGGKVRLREGVARLLEECIRADVKMAIASTTTATNIDALLRCSLGADATQWFSVIGAGDIVERKKPAPDIYEWTLNQLQESSADCVAIEDSANGLRAAKAAGLFTVVTPTGWTMDEDFSTADLILPYLGSRGRPLTEIAAAQVGGAMLGVTELERQLLTQPATLRHDRQREAKSKRT